MAASHSHPSTTTTQETVATMAPYSDFPSLTLADNKMLQQVEQTISGLKLSEESQRRIRDVFESEMEKGLSGEESSLQMENTFIPELPDGSEEGEYLALDLGGTNFRVCLLILQKGALVKEELKHYHVSDPLRVGTGEALFDFLAECIHDFLSEKGLLQRNFPLGFTFSFPMEHRSIDVGILLSWTKTFNCSDVVGQSASHMLTEAIRRRGDLDVDVVAVLNDTTGTLVQGAFLDHRCAVGLIIGSGCNACYIERVDRIRRWKGDHPGVKEVIIDIEWGAFGDNGALDFIKTDFDREVDNKSLLVNSFTFEKYVAGTYMGEIVRVILVKLTREKALFNGVASEQLLTHGSFTSSFISLIEEDNLKNSSEHITKILQDLNLTFGADDMTIVKHVCSVVSTRAALLVSICLASVLQRIDRQEITIAVDGSLFKYHPRLKQLMAQNLRIMAPEKKFQLLLAEDGSGKGAGLVAAIAKKLQNRDKSSL